MPKFDPKAFTNRVFAEGEREHRQRRAMFARLFVPRRSSLPRVDFLVDRAGIARCPVTIRHQ